MNRIGYIYLMKPRKKEVGKAGRVVADLLVNLAQTREFTYRSMAAKTGMSINRIGIIFRNEGPAIEVDELFAFCSVFEVRPFCVVAAAEWVISGQRPALEGDDVDWKQIYDLAATVNPELRLPPELEQVLDKKTAPKPQLAPHESPKIEHLFKTKATPLFSDRRDDGDPGNEALPRMA